MKFYCHFLSFLSWLKNGSPYISGHDWFQREDGELECRRCKTISHWFIPAGERWENRLICTNCGEVREVKHG